MLRERRMASIQQTKNGKFQVRIKNKVLPKPLFFIFDTIKEARVYADNAIGMLKQGIVPQVLMDLSAQKKRPIPRSTAWQP